MRVLICLLSIAACILVWNLHPPDNLADLAKQDAAARAYIAELRAAQQPIFDWRSVPSETFALRNAEIREWTLKSGKFRIRFSAASPITFAAGNPEQLKAQFVLPVMQGVDAPRLRPAALTCAEPRVIEKEVTCELADGDEIVVQDDRGLKEEGMGALQTVLGRNATALSTATANNTVKMDLSVWACVRNCPVPR